MALKLGENQAVQMPMKTVISLIVIVALGTMGYFQIVERLNIADTKIKIMEKDLEENTEFRIKWPRGEMGSLPADSEQFMMLEDLYKQTDKINKQLESMMNNRINIEFLRGQMDKVLADIEALKDKNREMYYNEYGMMNSLYSGSVYENKNNNPFKYNPEEAMRLLKEAGYTFRSKAELDTNIDGTQAIRKLILD